MYHIGDKVLHQSAGACYITEIVERQVNFKTKRYFQLESIIDQQPKLYVSTEKHERMRLAIDKSALSQLETKFQKEKPCWSENPRERSVQYQEKIESNNFSDALGVFGSLTIEQKKSKLSVKDEYLRKQSEKMVCSEIAIILNKAYDYVANEVTKYILETNTQTA